jgi:transposase InsO family protein
MVKTTNFVRWSWYTIIHLTEPCGNDCISMRSTWPRAQNSLDKIGRTTTPFVIGRTRYQLMDIFLLFGAPHILQSDNGSEFTAQIISDLKELWPELVIVHGKPRHPQSQGSVERGNDCISMRSTWPRAENSLDKIGRTTTPFVIGRTRLRWQSMHIVLRSW